MFARWITAALSLPLVPCLALAQDGVAPIETRTFDLRAAPALAVGDRTRERALMVQTGVIATKHHVVGEGDDVVNRLDQELEYHVLEEVLALAPTGEAERSLRTYEQIRSGARQRSYADRPLLLVRKPDSTEAVATASGVAFDDAWTRQLQAFRRAERAQSQPAIDVVVPAAPVAVGERWALSPDGVAALVALFDMAMLESAEIEPEEVLEAEGTLASVEQKDGVDLLHVEVRLRLSIKDLADVTFDPPAEFVMTVRYLTTGAASRLRTLTFEATFKGTLSFAGVEGTRISRDLRLLGERRVDAVERGE